MARHKNVEILNGGFRELRTMRTVDDFDREQAERLAELCGGTVEQHGERGNRARYTVSSTDPERLLRALAALSGGR